jgi:hypothetical protein
VDALELDRAARLGDHLADRVRVASLPALLTSLSAREHAACLELAQLLKKPGPRAAAEDLSRLLERLAKGER